MSALGSLVVKLGLEYAEYTGGLAKSEQAALAASKKIQDTFDGMKSKVAATAGAIAGGLAAGFTVAAFKNLIAGSIETGAALDDLRMQTGGTVEALSGLLAVGKFNNVGPEQLGSAMNKLSANLAGATEESKGAAKAVEALGLDFDKFRKMRPEDQMQTVAQAMSKFEDGTSKSAVAMALYGKEGAKMLPFLHDLAEVGDLQAKVTTEQAAAAANLDDNLLRLSTSGEGWKKELANGMIPALDLGVQALVDMTSGTGGLRDEVKRLVADGSIKQWTADAIKGLSYVADVGHIACRRHLQGPGRRAAAEHARLRPHIHENNCGGMVMTSLVPVHRVLGTGAPVKKRNVWSGADRLVRSIVGGHKDVFQLRPKLGGGAVTCNMVAHNGVDMYVLSGTNTVYTSPDLATLTSRAVPAGGAWSGASQVVPFQGDFFATYSISATPVIARSSDKGVTWVNYPSGTGSRMSVVGGLLYFLSNGNTTNFSTTNAPGTAATARAFSRSAYWSKVVGTPTRQYCFGASGSGDAATLDKADVATNGTSFSQDAACEALMAAAPVGMRHAHAIANGKTLLFNATSDGLYSLVADAAGVWSVGAAIPGELGDGYRLYGVGLAVANTGNAQIVTDAEGVTYVLMVVQDGFGNYLPRVACTYDGVDWWWLPPHSNLGTTAPNYPMGMYQRIDGRVMAHFNSTRFVEANPNAVELYYEI